MTSFTRAIAAGKPRGLEHADKVEQEIAESCNRLIENTMICWNHFRMTIGSRLPGAGKSGTGCPA